MWKFRRLEDYTRGLRADEAAAQKTKRRNKAQDAPPTYSLSKKGVDPAPRVPITSSSDSSPPEVIAAQAAEAAAAAGTCTLRTHHQNF